MRHERRALLLVMLAAAFAAPPAHAQISPGPLAKAHASLDGPLNCVKCHGGGGSATMTSRCVSCHREIAALTAQNRGYHARAGRADCASCHPDHAGRDFDLVKWPDGSAQRFNHARAGWALEEKHARTSCEKCHTADLRKSPVAELAPKRTSTGWIGLETSCVSCHNDVHAGSLSRDCQTCHTAGAWSPAPRFDHAKSDYPLTGKHADVTCAKCHTAPPKRAGDAKLTAAKFAPLPHADCASCHRDPHDGRLRGTCTSCHVTTSFSTVNDRAFSHDRTRYPLRGKHGSASCASCHRGYPGKIDQPAFATCATCHTDPHAGKATLAGASVDCASCHSVAGFATATFTVAQHARTAYPLQGKHASVSCASCHVRREITAAARPRGRGAAPAREVVMRPVADRCESCHTDAHAGQLAKRVDRGACVSCHTLAGWKPTTFDVRQHADLKLPLTGKHATTDCGSCHSFNRKLLPPLPSPRTLGSANVAFALAESSCESCHRDPHGGKYVKQGDASCAACHDTRAFHPSTVGREAHAKFAFALEGAHRAAPCVACHTVMKNAGLGASLKLAPQTAPLAYTLPGATCTTCHGAPHGDQFLRRPGGEKCESCHDLNAWAPAARFDHAANGGFVLGSAHARVPCAKCHVGAERGAARTWRGVSRTCESCHRGDVRRG